MHKIDNLGHGRLAAALALGWTRKLDCFAIAQKATRQQQIIQVRRRGLEVERVHSERRKWELKGGFLAVVIHREPVFTHRSLLGASLEHGPVLE